MGELGGVCKGAGIGNSGEGTEDGGVLPVLRHPDVFSTAPLIVIGPGAPPVLIDGFRQREWDSVK